MTWYPSAVWNYFFTCKFEEDFNLHTLLCLMVFCSTMPNILFNTGLYCHLFRFQWYVVIKFWFSIKIFLPNVFMMWNNQITRLQMIRYSRFLCKYEVILQAVRYWLQLCQELIRNLGVCRKPQNSIYNVWCSTIKF